MSNKVDDYKSYRFYFSVKLKEIEQHFFRFSSEWDPQSLKACIGRYNESRFTPVDKNSAVITTKEMLGEIIKWFREKELLIQVEDLDTNDMIDINMPVEDSDCMLPLEDVAYKSAKIVFKKSIKEIDEDFFGPKSGINWGVDTVRELVETYEVARFTQIEDNVAIVTCDDIYNFGYMIDFFKSQYEITEKIKILD